MKALVTHGAAGLWLFACVATVSAQSLGDLARQEEERRKTITTASEVYTNESLRPEGGPAGTFADPSSESPQAEAGADAETDAEADTESDALTPADGEPAPDPDADPENGSPEEGRAGTGLTEAEWRQRVADARQAQSRARVLADALQSRINVLAADFVNRDDPAQRDVVAADRERALAELARVTDDIEQHQQTVIDIQEEARRAGVPAGWVR